LLADQTEMRDMPRSLPSCVKHLLRREKRHGHGGNLRLSRDRGPPGSPEGRRAAHRWVQSTGVVPILSVLAGCASVGPDYHPPSVAELGIPQSYTGSGQLAAAPELSRWWQGFHDPLLSQLVSDANAANLDLAVSEARLTQAREAVLQAKAGGVPTVTASTSVQGRADTNDDSSANYAVAADASWEIDLFGRIRRGVEAARADAEGSYFDREAVRVAVIGDVASNYMQARLAQARLALANDSITIAADNLRIAQWRVQAGLSSSLDAEQARTVLAQVQATLPALQDQYNAAVHRLAVLTGRAPEALAPAFTEVRPIPTMDHEVTAGIPAETLRQRPDVRSSERALAAATARIGVAQAQLYPDLRLTGSIGTSALSLGGLIDVITGSLFAGIDHLLFDAGRARSQTRSQQAAAQAALATYRRSVLSALEDVENALSALTAARQRQVSFTDALTAANNTAIIARSQYRAGLIDFQTLLEAERSLVSARDGMLASRGAEALALVQLYRALGGGWDASGANAGRRA
jgi:NodT family efflux transporter outer membrane factor (OMF) lipoprotein